MPEIENKEIQKIIDKIKEAEKLAEKEKKNILINFDLDFDTFFFTTEVETDIEIEQTKVTLDFYYAKNQFEEKNYGIINFSIKPNKSKDFFLLYIDDYTNKEKYTLFINPFYDLEIFKGEVSIEDFL